MAKAVSSVSFKKNKFIAGEILESSQSSCSVSQQTVTVERSIIKQVISAFPLASGTDELEQTTIEEMEEPEKKKNRTFKSEDQQKTYNFYFN